MKFRLRIRKRLFNAVKRIAASEGTPVEKFIEEKLRKKFIEEGVYKESVNRRPTKRQRRQLRPEI